MHNRDSEERRAPIQKSKNQVYEKTLRSSCILEANGKAILKRINTIECGREKRSDPPKTSTRFDPSK